MTYSFIPLPLRFSPTHPPSPAHGAFAPQGGYTCVLPDCCQAGLPAKYLCTQACLASERVRQPIDHDPVKLPNPGFEAPLAFGEPNNARAVF